MDAVSVDVDAVDVGAVNAGDDAVNTCQDRGRTPIAQVKYF